MASVYQHVVFPISPAIKDSFSSQFWRSFLRESEEVSSFPNLRKTSRLLPASLSKKMVHKKRLSSGVDFSETYTCDLEFRLKNSIGFLPPSPPDSPVHNSPEKLDSSPAAFEETSSLMKSRKKRKRTLSSSHATGSKRVWSKDDELVILKGIVDYRNETGVDYLSDSAAFFEYIKDNIDGKVTKDQLMNKMRKLKKKFRDSLVERPCFTNSQGSETFDLSLAIWGKDKAGCIDRNTDRAKGTRSKVQDLMVTNGGEPGNDDGSAKGDSSDKLPSENVDKNMESENGSRKEGEEDGTVTINMGNETGGKESEEDGAVTKYMGNETGGKESEEGEAVTNDKHENNDGSAKGKLPSKNVDRRMEICEKESEEDGTADELGALQDALETIMFQHLGNYAQKLMLQKLKILGAKERKELSEEWKSLLVEEAQLKSKKYQFAAKLANAAFHN